MIKFVAAALAAGAVAGAGIGIAHAQRSPAYQAARAAGQVGELPTGYLGIVGSETAELRAMVADINMKRRAEYSRQAADGGGTVQQRAFTAGCNLIAQTRSGERYMGPDGQWKTRGAGAPERDPACV